MSSHVAPEPLIAPLIHVTVTGRGGWTDTYDERNGFSFGDVERMMVAAGRLMANLHRGHLYSVTVHDSHGNHSGGPTYSDAQCQILGHSVETDDALEVFTELAERCHENAKFRRGI
jgi:hypothetical protein